MIARALMHTPQVLFLDEPSTGLDPAARLFVWDRIRDLRDQGVTIVITTHDMDEASTLAERVGIMDHGQLLALDTARRAHPQPARQAPRSRSRRPAPTAACDQACWRRSSGWTASSGWSGSLAATATCACYVDGRRAADGGAGRHGARRVTASP